MRGRNAEVWTADYGRLEQQGFQSIPSVSFAASDIFSGVQWIRRRVRSAPYSPSLIPLEALRGGPKKPTSDGPRPGMKCL